MINKHLRRFITSLPLVLALGGCVSSQATTSNSQISVPSPTAVVVDVELGVTVSSPTPIPTEPATAAIAPISTSAPPATAIAEPEHPSPTPALPLEVLGPVDTLILYTTLANLELSPSQPLDVVPDDYWAFRTLPPLPFLDPAVFDPLFGKYQYGDDLSLRFLDFRPRLSPDGRYLLLPGIGGYPEAGIEGTGLWLIDFVDEVARELLPDGRFATWSPASDAITYTVGDTLYALSIAEGAIPVPLFEHPTLSNYAHWSPDGRWIAALTSADPESIDSENPTYASAYWLVPTNGDPARELTVQETFAMEYTTGDMSWSLDGQYLLVRNKVFDLEGNLLSPDYPGGVHWVPNDSRLLVNGQEGLRIMTITGEEIAHLSDAYADVWAFSRDGQRLAYALRQEESGVDASILVYDLERGESQVIGVIPQAYYVELLRWSADDSRVIVGLGRNEGDEIWAIDARPGSTAELLLDGALLIEVVPYPVP